MRARVLVTRPEPGASITAHRLRDAGFDPVVLPLTAITALPVDRMPPAADAVVATSANAIRHAPAQLIAQLTATPCFAVGVETANAAKAGGFRDVVAGEGDADALARLVVARTRPGARIAYLAGRVRRDGLERALAASGRSLAVVETYDVVFVACSPTAIVEALGSGRIDAVLLYSGKAAEALRALADVGGRFGSASLLGLSERIGTALPLSWRKRFRSAGTPDEEALFRLIEDAFPPVP